MYIHIYYKNCNNATLDVNLWSCPLSLTDRVVGLNKKNTKHFSRHTISGKTLMCKILVLLRSFQFVTALSKFPQLDVYQAISKSETEVLEDTFKSSQYNPAKVMIAQWCSHYGTCQIRKLNCNHINIVKCMIFHMMEQALLPVWIWIDLFYVMLWHFLKASVRDVLFFKHI